MWPRSDREPASDRPWNHPPDQRRNKGQTRAGRHTKELKSRLQLCAPHKAPRRRPVIRRRSCPPCGSNDTSDRGQSFKVTGRPCCAETRSAGAAPVLIIQARPDRLPGHANQNTQHSSPAVSPDPASRLPLSTHRRIVHQFATADSTGPDDHAYPTRLR